MGGLASTLKAAATMLKQLSDFFELDSVTAEIIFNFTVAFSMSPRHLLHKPGG
jgi:hypothetical protein